MKTKTTRRRTPPLPLLLALALPVFAAGLLAGWTGAAALALRDQGPSVAPGPVPAQSAPPLPTPTPIPSPDRPSTAEEDWALVLVNGDHPLPESFTVPGLTQLRNGHAIDQRAYPALQAMMDGCRPVGGAGRLQRAADRGGGGDRGRRIPAAGPGAGEHRRPALAHGALRGIRLHPALSNGQE